MREIVSAVSRSALSANFNKNFQKCKFWANFENLNFKNFIKFLAEEDQIKFFSNTFLSLTVVAITLPLKISTYFNYYNQNCAKFYQNLKKM